MNEDIDSVVRKRSRAGLRSEKPTFYDRRACQGAKGMTTGEALALGAIAAVGAYIILKSVRKK